MISMTGYGRGQAAKEGLGFVVELSSVNRKQLEIGVLLPRELEAMENKVREVVQGKVARGRVTARVTLELDAGQAASRAGVNQALAKAYADELRGLAKELSISTGLTLDTLVRLPGVIEKEDRSTDADAAWPTVKKAVVAALKEFVSMRKSEGENMAKDLSARIKAINKAVARITKRAPKVSEHYRTQLNKRLAEANLELKAEDDDRLLREVALFADRSDISEELTRLKSHFDQFDGFVKSAKPVGRTLDFLAQEMNREINTIGSKANDSDISKEVVFVKAELEKFREQVQNVE